MNHGSHIVQYIKLCWCVCVRVLPGTELAEGLEGGGGHEAESSVVAQQQEGQHLKSQQHRHTLKFAFMMSNYITTWHIHFKHIRSEIHRQLCFHPKCRYKYHKKQTERLQKQSHQINEGFFKRVLHSMHWLMIPRPITSNNCCYIEEIKIKVSPHDLKKLPDLFCHIQIL